MSLLSPRNSVVLADDISPAGWSNTNFSQDYADDWSDQFAAQQQALLNQSLSEERSNNVVQLDVYRTDDSRRANTAALPIAIQSNWFEWQRAALGENSKRRIATFAAEREGWLGEGTHPLTQRSLNDFLTFWRLIAHAASEPEFALAPTGHLQAEWHRDWRHHLEILFLGDGRVRYSALFGKNTHCGECGVGKLKDVILSLSSRLLRPE